MSKRFSVALCAALGLWAAQAPFSRAHTEETDTSKFVFMAPEGWKAKLTGEYRQEIAALYAENKPDDDSFKYQELRARDDSGFWIKCDLAMNGERFEVYRETKAKILLRTGDMLESTVIVALADPQERLMLNNGLQPFLVHDRLAGAKPNLVRLYFRFSESFEPGDLVAWRLVEYVPRESGIAEVVGRRR